MVWDCGTGNGQAARDLARYFDRVIATDGSAEQISHAVPTSGVEFRVARADDSGLVNHSVDAVTVAQALHWFANDAFFAEVHRVTIPGGLVAAWSYGSCHVGPDIDDILLELQDGTVGPYWAPERRWVDEAYQTIPFPFPAIPAPTFALRATWTLRQLGAYLDSWSSVTKYKQTEGSDPVAPAIARIARHWGSPDEARAVTWPLHLRVGRVG